MRSFIDVCICTYALRYVFCILVLVFVLVYHVYQCSMCTSIL